MAEKINLPVPIQTRGPMKQINEILNKKGGEILDWTGTSTLYRFFYLYLFKKYKHNCRIYTRDFLGIDIGSSFNAAKHELQYHANQFKKCYDRGSDMIVIPIRFKTSPTSGHANFLLFKRELHIIERFEPYGYSVISKTYSFVEDAIEYFVDEINKKISRPIRYSRIEESCHEFGIQFEEEHIEGLQKEKKEGSGYCVIWSMFFTELSLANPSYNLKQLTDAIYSIKKPGIYLRDIARGYVYFFYEKMNKYFIQYLSPIMTFNKFIQNYETKDKIKKKHIFDAFDTLNQLFKLEMELYENPYTNVDYLTNDANTRLNELNKKYTSVDPISRKYIDTEINELRIRIDILNKMKRNQTNLDKFTPVVIEEPRVFVMDVKNSTISKIATPLGLGKNKNVLIKKKPPCKEGKERNEDGRCVKIKTAKVSAKPKKEKTLKVKEKPPCKEGKARNADGRCVKIKTTNHSKSKKLQVEIEKIVLPDTLSPLSLSSLSSLSPDTPIVKPLEMPKSLAEKSKPPCKPGKVKNANGRCVKIKTAKSNVNPKEKSKTLKSKSPCKPGKVKNKNGRCVKKENIK